MAQKLWRATTIICLLISIICIEGCIEKNSDEKKNTSSNETLTLTETKQGIKAVPDPLTGFLSCPKNTTLFSGWCVPCMPYEMAISTTKCQEIILGPSSYIDLNHPYASSTCPANTNNNGGKASTLIGIAACKPVPIPPVNNPSPTQTPPAQYCTQTRADLWFPEHKARGWLTMTKSCEDGMYAHDFVDAGPECLVQTRYNSWYPNNAVHVKCDRWSEGKDGFVSIDSSKVPTLFECKPEGLKQIPSKDLFFVRSKFFNIGTTDYPNCPAVRFSITSGNSSALRCCNYPNPNSRPTSQIAGCVTKDFTFNLNRLSGWQGNTFKRITQCNNMGEHQWPYPYSVVTNRKYESAYAYCHDPSKKLSTWANVGWFGSEYAGFVLDCSHTGGYYPTTHVSGTILCCRDGMEPTQNYIPGSVREILSPQ